jgi:hypothetical protein
MIYLAKSRLSKIILFLGLISILITTIKYLSLKIFLVQVIIFYIFISSTDCNIYGKCYSTGYFYLLLAIIVTLFLIFDYFGVFNSYKKLVRRLYSIYESSNDSNFKQIIFANENEITQFYKTRTLPKIINKNFKHTTINEELDEDDIKTINRNNKNLLNNNIDEADNLLI